MTNPYIIALFGLFSTLIGITLTLIINRRQNKIKETFELYKEFNSESMKRNRNKAYKLLLNNPQKKYDEISDELSAEETNPLWHVMGFYQKLWVLIEHKQVSRKLIPRLFGELFIWWYIFSFKENLVPIKWDVSKDMEALAVWLKGKTSPIDYKRWEKRVNEEMKGRISSNIKRNIKNSETLNLKENEENMEMQNGE